MAIPGSQVGNEQEHREHQTVYNKHLRNDSIFGDNAFFFQQLCYGVKGEKRKQHGSWPIRDTA